MTTHAELVVPWADSDYTFALRWGELVKLQEELGAGPLVVLQNLLSGKWRVQEISSTIRLGLIGGGMEPAQALRMVRDHVENRPPIENLALAQGILGIALQGSVDEAPGEPEGQVATED